MVWGITFDRLTSLAARFKEKFGNTVKIHPIVTFSSLPPDAQKQVERKDEQADPKGILHINSV